MSRPLKEINWDIVEKRMESGCSAKEIAAAHRIEINTFYDRFKRQYGRGFADYADNYVESGRGNIRFTQYMKALSGNVNLLLMLGKEWLGQGKEEVKESPFQDNINISHENMILRAEIANLKGNNGNQCETGQEFCGSDSSV